MTRARGDTSYPVTGRTAVFCPLASKILVASNWIAELAGSTVSRFGRRRVLTNGLHDSGFMNTNATLQFAPGITSALQPVSGSLCAQSRCAEWGIAHADFEQILLAVGAKYLPEGTQSGDAAAFFKSLKVEELALARGCAAGHERAWEVFLTRYREKLFEMALSIARDGPTARELAGVARDLESAVDDFLSEVAA